MTLLALVFISLAACLLQRDRETAEDLSGHPLTVAGKVQTIKEADLLAEPGISNRRAAARPGVLV